jgi:predicted Zn finger-like uncharacterized protein
MDVRCEKCMTVYEFDDSQVGENGVTVKCTQCGNLFKVKKRITMAELSMGAAPRSPAWQPPSHKTAAPVPPGPTYTPAPAPPPPPAPNLQPPRATPTKGVPQPARSNSPERPNPTVQAKRPMQTPARGHTDDELALSTTAPMTSPTYEGPSSMGDHIVGDDPAFASTAPKPRITPPPHMAQLGANLDAFDEMPRRRSLMPVYIGGGVLLLVLVGGGLLLRGRGSSADTGRAHEQYLQGRNLFLMDTEDAFHQADALMQQAHGAQSDNPLVLAALGELDAVWAGYLRDEAREIEAKTGAAGEVATRTLRKTAQQHLDDAKRYTGDALALSPDGLEVNRAMAEFLRVDGAPMAEAERYLKRALDKRPGDAESTFAMGALLYREGRMEEAHNKLEQANTLALGATQKPLFRALFLLGRLDLQTGHKDEARRELTQLTSLNPQHERGRILLQSLDVQVPPTPAPVVAAAPVPTPAAAAPPPVKKPAADEEPAVGGDYNKLVAQADRLSENGQNDRARKLYERALTVNPHGVEALTGLGYVDLDSERFMAALDHFRQALSAVPEYGEALIGLAEAYKMRGDKVHAVEFYKRYLKSQPGGEKAAMAQKNIRDLEAHLPPPETPAAPEEKKPEAKIEKGDERELPKPPQNDEPPP